MNTITLTVRVERERLSDGLPIYVALCLELDIACQGSTIEEATENVVDAAKLFFEVASPSEVQRRLPISQTNDMYLGRIEVPLGQTVGLIGAGAVRNLNNQSSWL